MHTSGQLDPKLQNKAHADEARSWVKGTGNAQRRYPFSFCYDEYFCKGAIRMPEQHTYFIENRTFIVTPVYASGKGEMLISILLNLMKADADKIPAASASLT